MQSALAYRSNAIARSREAAKRMEPLAREWPATREEVTRYVQQLFSADEQIVRNRAMD